MLITFVGSPKPCMQTSTNSPRLFRRELSQLILAYIENWRFTKVRIRAIAQINYVSLGHFPSHDKGTTSFWNTQTLLV